MDTLRATLEELTAFPRRLESCYLAIAPTLRNWRPESWAGIPSERLSAIEQICHVRDIEIDGYHARIQRTLTERAPVLADIDGESLARERAYSAQNETTALRAFRSARDTTVAMLGALTPEQWSRTAVFENKPTTLRGLLHYLASHDQQHLAGLHWLAAKMEAIGLA